MDLKVGDRVYYSIYYDQGFFNDAPKTDQNIRRIETLEPFNDFYMATLEGIDYTMILSEVDNGKILKGEAIANFVEPTNREDVAKAFITNNYLNYSRETILYYRRTLSNTPELEKDWNGDLQPSWKYATTLASLKKFLKRLDGTNYEELYPEDFI